MSGDLGAENVLLTEDELNALQDSRTSGSTSGSSKMRLLALLMLVAAAGACIVTLAIVVPQGGVAKNVDRNIIGEDQAPNDAWTFHPGPPSAAPASWTGPKCTLPVVTTGFNVKGCNAPAGGTPIWAFNCKLACAAGWNGPVPTATCAINNGVFGGLTGCTANTCTCPKGTATTANGVGPTLCGTNGAVDCSQCDPGYHLSAKAGHGAQTCKPNTCTCSDGTQTTATGTKAAKADLCETHGVEDCEKCNAGFQLSAPAGTGAQKCHPNPPKCKLPAPPATTGYDISGCNAPPAGTANKLVANCALKCAKGYNGPVPKATCATNGGTFGGLTGCTANKCTCPGGTATTATGVGAAKLCETDGTVDCSACDPGFHPSATFATGQQTCDPNVCTCPGGTATTATGAGPTLCGADGTVDCSACNPGFHKSAAFATGAQTCIPNTCTCTHGTATHATGTGGTLCQNNGDHDCAKCGPGYVLSAPAGPGKQTCQKAR